MPRLFVALPCLAVLLRLSVALAMVVALLPLPVLAQTPPAIHEIFAGDSPLRAIAYTFPLNDSGQALPPLCALARDLPLIAESGANVVLTRGIPLQDGDHIFLNLLASTGLAWVASFPLPDDVDPSVPLLNQRDLLLARFSNFASRFAGNPSLRGVVVDFGDEHAAVTSQLANDFAAVLESYFPVSPPRLGQIASNPASLNVVPVGVGFWVYRFSGSIPSGLTRLQLEMRTSLPILFDLSAITPNFLAANSENPVALGVAWQDYLADFTLNDPMARVVALRFLADNDAAGNGDAPAESALFQVLQDTDGFENLYPTVLTESQRQTWDAEPLKQYTARPSITEVRNPGTETPYFSPGARMEIEGAFFQEKEDTIAHSQWPLHAGAVCLCVGQRPVPVGELAGTRILAQLPWLLPTGTHELRVVREGVTSAARSVNLLDYSPGIFGDTLLYKETACGLMESSGLEAGDIFDLYVTGAGPLNGGVGDLQVSLDGTVMELLHVGLESSAPGIALIRARVQGKASVNGAQGLQLRRGTRMSNVLPISYATETRPGIALVTSTATVQLQPKGSTAPITIQTEGLHGYCGPVDFEVLGLPQGVSATVGSAMSGQVATLQLRADGTATPVQDHPFYLYAFPVGGDPQMLTMRLHVLPSTGPVLLTVESAGFAAGSTARMGWNEEVLLPTGMENARGLYLLLVNPVSGTFAPVELYDLWDSAEESARLEARLQGLSTGTIVAMAIADEATFEMQSSLRALIEQKLGSRAIATLGYQHSWAIISKVGAAEPIAEATSANTTVRVQATLELPR